MPHTAVVCQIGSATAPKIIELDASKFEEQLEAETADESLERCLIFLLKKTIDLELPDKSIEIKVIKRIGIPHSRATKDYYILAESPAPFVDETLKLLDKICGKVCLSIASNQNPLNFGNTKSSEPPDALEQALCQKSLAIVEKYKKGVSKKNRNKPFTVTFSDDTQLNISSIKTADSVPPDNKDLNYQKMKLSGYSFHKKSLYLLDDKGNELKVPFTNHPICLKLIREIYRPLELEGIKLRQVKNSENSKPKYQLISLDRFSKIEKQTQLFP